jgi:iron complex transport system substrate-binding protein
LINDIISLCGGSNIFADLTLIAPKISVEAVVSRNPEVIVASGMDQERPEWLNSWRDWPSLAAVAADNLFFIPPDLLQRHTPRALEGARALCEYIDSAR